MKIAKLIVDRRIDGKSPDGHPCHKVLPVNFNDKGIDVQIIQCSALNQTAGCSLIKIVDRDGAHAEELKDRFYSNINGECSIVKVGSNQYLATVMNNSCELSRIVAESGIFLTSARPITDDLIEWTVWAPNGTYIRNFLKRANDMGYHITRHVITDPDAEMKLTSKQEDIIKYAVDNGYYEIPRRITIDDLCREFSCSKSTMSVVMREAENKIIGLYVEGGRPRMAD